jgi:DNA repair photolyase
MNTISPLRGRGTPENPTNRFEKLHLEEGDYVQHLPDQETPSPRTQFFEDPSRTIVSKNDSPDVGFDFSINPYRGCEHGCVYCFARPTHEFLGLSAGLDFETKIFYKKNAAELLREKLQSKSWKPAVIALSGVTDCYQPIERKLRLTRSCIEVLGEFRNPFSIITKNHLVTRDIDLIKPMAQINGARVLISITTTDPKLAEKMEPRTSYPLSRFKAVEKLASAGIPVGVLMAPIIPGLNDHEIPQILKLAKSAGADYAGYVPIRLPYVLDELFESWLLQHYPDRKDKILNRIREIRGGKLNVSEFGSRMRGEGVYADQIRSMFHLYARKEKLNERDYRLTTEHFRRGAVNGQTDFGF